MPLILGTNSIKDTGYNVANSCRFEAAYLKRTVTASTSNTWTLSFWLKKSGHNGSSEGYLFSYGSDGGQGLYISAAGYIGYYGASGYTSDSTLSSGVLKDPSAWYHILFSVSSGTGTLYINGVQDAQISNVAPLNATSGTAYGVNSYINYEDNFDNFLGYLTEYVFIDGTAYNQNSFGEFDEDSPTIWKPIDVSGLTFGTNGFYLDFEDSSDLGKDVSGNGNDFTATRLAATDQSTDTCTNNYCTMNPLDHSATHNSTFSEGNLKVVTSASLSPPHFATFGLTTGKWYWEVKATSFTEDPAGYITIGITGNQGNSNTSQLGNLSGDYAFVNNGNIEAGTGNDTSYGNSYTQGQIIGVYLDLDNNKLYFSINGSLQNSGTGHSILASSSTTAGFYMPSFSDYSSSSSNLVTVEFNFGAGTTFSISSGNTDGEYGNFEYSTTITGDGASKTFKAINSKNLAEYG